MPSSLIFAALVVAWLVVLVPMVARHRQQVARTDDAELAARVLPRNRVVRADEEVNDVPEPTDTEAGRYADRTGGADYAEGSRNGSYRDEGRRPDEGYSDGEGYPDDWEAEHTRRRYRPGRGGFDPEAAALAAQAKYAYRQRVVLVLLIVAVVSALGALVVSSGLWWLHGLADLMVVGYLGYLRRQVRIESEIRTRRADRLAGVRHEHVEQYAGDEVEDEEQPESEQAEIVADVAEEEPPPRQPAAREPKPEQPAGTAVLELDDEDPSFHELDDQRPAIYRRASGE